MLPDEVLMQIFAFDRPVSIALSQGRQGRSWEWHRLIHVCQRWRYIIFDSPRSLDLQLFCTYGTPVKNNLDCWPALPIAMQYLQSSSSNPLPVDVGDEDNIIAALQYPNRIFSIQLTVTNPLLDRLAALVQERFPALEFLELTTQTETGLILPSESFRGPFAKIRVLNMTRIAFPALQRLLLSAENLVSLHLEALPSSEYISPEATLIFLPVMTRLEKLHLHFLSPIYRPISRGQNPALQRRAVLPALENFAFYGVSDDLECLSSRIDAPVLKCIDITFFNQATIFDTPQFVQFLCRTETQRSHDEAKVYCSETNISITLTQGGRPHQMGLRVQCMPLHWQLSCMAEICDNLSLVISDVQDLHMDAYSLLPSKRDEMDPLPLLELFRPFSNVKRLFLTKNVARHVKYALKQEAAAGVLPNTSAQDTEQTTGSLHTAAKAGRVEIVRSLLAREEDVNARDPDQGTPLLYASKFGHLDIVRLLIEHGAEVNSRDQDQGTPLLYASKFGHFDTFLLLIKHGADVNSRDQDQGTPLLYASKIGRLRIVHLLIDRGAEVNSRDLDLGTLLLYALKTGRLDIVRLLIEHGADVNSRDRDRWTPLHYASQFGYIGVAKLLMNHGASVNVWNVEGQTPIHVSTAKGHLEIVKLLLERGASPRIMDRHYRIPYEIASQSGNREISQLLAEYGAS
jgi:ankyrin repeat protein